MFLLIYQNGIFVFTNNTKLVKHAIEYNMRTADVCVDVGDQVK